MERSGSRFMAIGFFAGLTSGTWDRQTALRTIFALLALSACSGAVYAQTSPPDKPATHISPKNTSPFEDAKVLLTEGRLEEAQRQLEEELKKHPSSAEGYALLGLVYSEQKNTSAALSAFQQALKLDPKSVRARNDLGNLYAADGKIDLAEKQFREVLRLSPADRDGNYNLGLVLLVQKKPLEALTYLQRVHPQDIPSRFNVARAYFAAGRTASGLKTAQELSTENKDNLQVHFTLGLLLASEKQFRPAQLELEQANALQPQTFEILHNLGEVYLRNSEYAKAETVLNRALKLKPDSTDTLFLLGQAYSDEHKPVDALDVLVRAHKLAPENPDVIFLLARASMSQNYYEDAIPLLEAGLKIAPNRIDLHAALGECYFMSGKVEKSIEEFTTLIRLDPSARSYAFLGLSYRRLGRFDEARKYFEQGLKRNPRNAFCLYNLGYIEKHQGNYSAAEHFFQETLRSNPDHPEALLELANLRIKSKKFEDAALLLKKYVQVSPNPAPGYYKLAMVERSLHQTDAAQRDLAIFQTLSKDASTGPYPYQHLFDYLDNRSNLSRQEKTQLDLADLSEEIQKHPDQPQDLYLLAEGYLKLGKVDDARKAIERLDQLSAADPRTQTGVGVLLARYHLYDDAIRHFQNALRADPASDDVKFDLADAYFRKGMYQQALDTAQQESPDGQRDDAYLALLGDIRAHLGQTAQAQEIYKNAIERNPDNDQYYLSLALLQLRQNELNSAQRTLQQGLARIPASGKLLWGQGLLSALEGNTSQAAEHLEQAVDLLPEWSGSYSTLGVFYYQTGRFDKAKEVLNRFKGSGASGGLDIGRIEEALEKAPPMPLIVNEPMSMASRQQLLQFALSIADRTL
jgi:tetratricopeptide (TPR) repeat protein